MKKPKLYINMKVKLTDVLFPDIASYTVRDWCLWLALVFGIGAVMFGLLALFNP